MIIYMIEGIMSLLIGIAGALCSLTRYLGLTMGALIVIFFSVQGAKADETDGKAKVTAVQTTEFNESLINPNGSIAGDKPVTTFDESPQTQPLTKADIIPTKCGAPVPIFLFPDFYK